MDTHRLFKYKKGDTIRYLCHTLETTRKQSQKLWMLTDFSNTKRDRDTARSLEISFLKHRERLEFDTNIQAQDREH